MRTPTQARQRTIHRLAMLALAVAPLVAHAEGGSDWPQFRGPNRDGISPETGLSTSWPDTGPKELWRVPLGEGYSAISIVAGRLYTMYATAKSEEDADGTEFAAAFDAATGAAIWKTPLGKRYETEFGNGPRATPTVDGDTVFVLSATGELAALATADGELRWKKTLTETFGGKVPHWGTSSSPLVDGKQLVLLAGGDEGKSLVGLDKATGETLWTSGKGGGYNSPMAITIAGMRRFVSIAGGTLRAVDSAGVEVWTQEWPKGETHATPLFIPPNRLYAAGAEGVGAHLYEIAEADGKGTITEIWAEPSLRNHFNQSVIHDGFVYGFDNATLKCVSLADGKMTWRKRGFGKGAVTYADGKLYVLADSGRLVLIAADPKEYVELGSAQALEGRCWTAPTISNGRLYLRNHEVMVAYDIRAEEG